MDKIYQEIMEDELNRAYTERGVPPLFKAPKEATMAIIGQAPGRKAEETQLFWNDPSGDRLREWMGLTREQFYESNKIAQLPMDFYYLGKAKTGDVPPRKEFAPKWHPRIIDELPNLKTILLIGNYSQKHYLKKTRQRNLTETVRHYEDYLPEFFPLVHPSPLNQRWLKINPWFEEEVIPVLRKLVQEEILEIDN
ncbi:uracil-DNA glycosylase family protein [Ruoffia tabacinasalis]|uniref:Uracil-DNA glycosylase family protein n=1 Tax=Ruoffia tabacinasalis TaxID=87458 RepID=A0A5R9DUJ8_9LACT|nr:uracil-DNA glycosylase family protein [Ruoffia tabacinasalis]TLQ38614.1 uracil-DNA glycosylase family protein [Ruoffia tabacinasalis]